MRVFSFMIGERVMMAIPNTSIQCAIGGHIWYKKSRKINTEYPVGKKETNMSFICSQYDYM